MWRATNEFEANCRRVTQQGYCGRVCRFQEGRWQTFGFETGPRTEVVTHEQRKFWFARIEAMGRLDHAGGVVILHLSRGLCVTVPTPVAERVEVVGLRGGKEQGKRRGDLHDEC